ncbi:hypothetical protein [Pseudodesulfovibrio methanolicus]|uniref:Uncharacterized protein n=1 Tax=Pseudodesulfovibrio methanolicus TaxID=3126690 RepID=A0ABZ2IYC8_9BACT
MPPIDRKAMRASLRSTHVRMMKCWLTTNPFPTNPIEYHESEWAGWIDRVKGGAEAALNAIPQLPAGCPPDYYAEEIVRERELSRIMLAALTVGMWAKLEDFLRRCIRAWNYDALSPIQYDCHKIVDFVKCFDQAVGIKLDDLPRYEYANAIRVLANTFKHNNGRYKPDSFPINTTIAKRWGIEERQKVDYEGLPFADLLLDCGAFCGELSERVRSKLTI